MNSLITVNNDPDDNDYTGLNSSSDDTELLEAVIRAARLGSGFYSEDDE